MTEAVLKEGGETVKRESRAELTRLGQEKSMLWTFMRVSGVLSSSAIDHGWRRRRTEGWGDGEEVERCRMCGFRCLVFRVSKG